MKKTERSEKTECVPETLGDQVGRNLERGRDPEDEEMEDKVDSGQEDEVND